MSRDLQPGYFAGTALALASRLERTRLEEQERCTVSTNEQHTAREEQASVLAKVSTVMVGLYHSQLGSGPTSARTYWVGQDAMSCFLENTLTPAERVLVEEGEHP